MNLLLKLMPILFAAGVFSENAWTDEKQTSFDDPRDAVRNLILRLQDLKKPTKVTTFRSLFEPAYFETTEPRAIEWNLAPLTRGKILWITTEGDGDIAMAAIQTENGVDVFAFALVEIQNGEERHWVIRPPGKQDPFSEILQPWHNRKTIQPNPSAQTTASPSSGL